MDNNPLKSIPAPPPAVAAGWSDLPPELEMRDSVVEAGKTGLWCKGPIPSGKVYGPFLGQTVALHTNKVPNCTVWQIRDCITRRVIHYLDASKPGRHHWMSHLKCSKQNHLKNVEPFQKGLQIYYRILKDLSPGDELVTRLDEQEIKIENDTPDLAINCAPPSTSWNPILLIRRVKPDPKKSGKKRKKPVFHQVEIKGGQPSSSGGVGASNLARPRPRPRHLTKKKREIKKSFLPELEDSPSNDFAPVDLLVKEVVATKINLNRSDMVLETVSKTTLASSATVNAVATSLANNNNKKSSSPSLTLKLKVKNDPKLKSKIEYDIKETSEENNNKKSHEFQFHLRHFHVIKGRQGKKLYKCDICAGMYRHAFSLKRHFIRTHINYAYLSAADIANCNINLSPSKRGASKELISSSSSSSALALGGVGGEGGGDTMKSESFLDLYRCHLCQDYFDTPLELKSHITNHPDTPTQKRFSCSQCDMTFSHKQNLVRHLSVHSGTKPHMCRYCNKTFPTIANQRRHERIHEGLKPYACAECEAVFTQSGDLRKHIKKQHRDTYFPCKNCSKYFAEEHLLLDHQSTHEAEKLEPVLEIQPNISSLNLLADIALSKGGESSASAIKYSCTECKKRFSSYVTMCRHRRSAHQVFQGKKGRNGNAAGSPTRSSAALSQCQSNSGAKQDRLANIPITEPEFYMTVAQRISDNLLNYVDGKAFQFAYQSSPRDNGGVPGAIFLPPQNSILPPLQNYNFPANFDLIDAEKAGLEMQETGGGIGSSKIRDYLPLLEEYGLCIDESYYNSYHNWSSASSESEPGFDSNLEANGGEALIGREAVPVTYICSVCGESFSSFVSIEDHKINNHPNVFCTHIEIEGEKAAPPELSLQFCSPMGALRQCNVPPLTAPPEEEGGTNGGVALNCLNCTKCNASFTSVPGLHLHILECGGDAEFVKQTTNFNARYSRRRGRPVKRQQEQPFISSSFPRKLKSPKKSEKTTEIKDQSPDIESKTINESIVTKEDDQGDEGDEDSVAEKVAEAVELIPVQVIPPMPVPEQNICDGCGKSFTLNSAFERHQKNCSMHIAMELSKMEEIKMEIEPLPKGPKSPPQSTEIDAATALEVASAVIVSPRKKTCPYCNKLFSFFTNMRKHRDYCLRKNPEKMKESIVEKRRSGGAERPMIMAPSAPPSDAILVSCPREKEESGTLVEKVVAKAETDSNAKESLPKLVLITTSPKLPKKGAKKVAKKGAKKVTKKSLKKAPKGKPAAKKSKVKIPEIKVKEASLSPSPSPSPAAPLEASPLAPATRVATPTSKGRAKKLKKKKSKVPIVERASTPSSNSLLEATTILDGIATSSRTEQPSLLTSSPVPVTSESIKSTATSILSPIAGHSPLRKEVSSSPDSSPPPSALSSDITSALALGIPFQFENREDDDDADDDERKRILEINITNAGDLDPDSASSAPSSPSLLASLTPRPVYTRIKAKRLRKNDQEKDDPFQFDDIDSVEVKKEKLDLELAAFGGSSPILREAPPSSSSSSSSSVVVSVSRPSKPSLLSQIKLESLDDSKAFSPSRQHQCQHCLRKFSYLANFRKHVVEGCPMLKQGPGRGAVMPNKELVFQGISPQSMKGQIEDLVLDLLREQSRQNDIIKPSPVQEALENIQTLPNTLNKVASKFKSFSCNVCHKIFLSYWKLLQHRLSHKLEGNNSELELDETLNTLSLPSTSRSPGLAPIVIDASGEALLKGLGKLKMIINSSTPANGSASAGGGGGNSSSKESFLLDKIKLTKVESPGIAKDTIKFDDLLKNHMKSIKLLSASKKLLPSKELSEEEETIDDPSLTNSTVSDPMNDPMVNRAAQVLAECKKASEAQIELNEKSEEEEIEEEKKPEDEDEPVVQIFTVSRYKISAPNRSAEIEENPLSPPTVFEHVSEEPVFLHTPLNIKSPGKLKWGEKKKKKKEESNAAKLKIVAAQLVASREKISSDHSEEEEEEEAAEQAQEEAREEEEVGKDESDKDKTCEECGRVFACSLYKDRHSRLAHKKKWGKGNPTVKAKLNKGAAAAAAKRKRTTQSPKRKSNENERSKEETTPPPLSSKRGKTDQASSS